MKKSKSNQNRFPDTGERIGRYDTFTAVSPQQGRQEFCFHPTNKEQVIQTTELVNVTLLAFVSGGIKKVIPQKDAMCSFTVAVGDRQSAIEAVTEYCKSKGVPFDPAISAVMRSDVPTTIVDESIPADVLPAEKVFRLEVTIPLNHIDASIKCLFGHEFVYVDQVYRMN